MESGQHTLGWEWGQLMYLMEDFLFRLYVLI